MVGLRALVRDWSARTRPRPVVLSSPYPVDECLRRLTQVTTTRMPTSWYLDSRTAVRPDPRFWGDVSPSGISVVPFAKKTSRGTRASFAPELRVRPEPADGNGTTLTGTIGMEQDSRDILRVMIGGFGFLALAFFAGGIAIVVGGDLSGLAPLLTPLAMIATITPFFGYGLQSLERHIPKLIADVNKTLGSSATFPGQLDGTIGSKLP
jgi:hypothetical protein